MKTGFPSQSASLINNDLCSGQYSDTEQGECPGVGKMILLPIFQPCTSRLPIFIICASVFLSAIGLSDHPTGLAMEEILLSRISFAPTRGIVHPKPRKKT